VATLADLAGSTYYQESWTALSLQMMTGQLRDLTANWARVRTPGAAGPPAERVGPRR